MIPANYSTISFPSLGIEVNPGRALALVESGRRGLPVARDPHPDYQAGV